MLYGLTGLALTALCGVTAIIAKVGNEVASSSITVNQLQGIALVKNVPVTGLAGAKEQAKMAQCLNNLRQMGLAAHNYEATYKEFPPGCGP